jgi:hypothetical protein
MTTRASILASIIKPNRGSFSEELANYVLSLGFSKDQKSRYEKLSKKAARGQLSDKEGAELDEYLETNALLMILKSKARMSLKRHSTAA